MATEHPEIITASARFYRLNRDEHLAKKKAQYDARPDVIQKREEKERKRAERDTINAMKKEAEKAVKRAEKEKKAQALVLVAEQTKRKFRAKPEAPFLGTEADPPVVVKKSRE
jgi:hypothetical protein